MNHDENSVCTYYGWCSCLPFRTIFFPVPAIIEKMPLSELAVKKHIQQKLSRYHHCISIGDVLNLCDEDLLSMRNTGPGILYEVRGALFQLIGSKAEEHEYFFDTDVRNFLQLLTEGDAPKISLLDSRKWMVWIYYKENGRADLGPLI